MDYDDERMRSKFWDKILLGAVITTLLMGLVLSLILMLPELGPS